MLPSINYRNGAVTVHGPNLNPQTPSSPPTIINKVNSIPMHPQNHAMHLNQVPHQHLPSGMISQPIPINRKSYNHAGSFSNSTASQSYLPDTPHIMTKHPDLFASQVIMPQNIHPSFVRTQSETASTQDKNTIFNIQVKKPRQEQIDCVICQRKFTSKQFQYHLQLHRNPKKKKQQITFDPFGLNKLDIPKINDKVNQIPLQNNKLAQNSMVNESKPQLLYSFQNKNNSFGDAQQNSAHNSKLLSVHQSNAPQSSHNSSKILSNDSLRSSKQVNQIQSGIRYIDGGNQNNFILNRSIHTSQSANTSKRQSNSNQAGQSFPTAQLSRQIPSVRSSQVSMPSLINKIQQRSFNTSREHAFGRLNPENIQISQPRLQQVKPFKLIQQQESRVYQYFPEMGHLSLSHHRIHGIQQQKSNFSHQFGQIPQPGPLNAKNLQNFSHTARNFTNMSRRVSNLNQKFNQTLSQPDQSSISSIHQFRQPLENMNRQQILKNYHTHRNRIDLSNIIGLSDQLAREGFTSSQRIKTQNFSSLRNTPSASVRQKTLTARSIILPNESRVQNGLILAQLNSGVNDHHQESIKNVQMAGVQGRQIFRGTQVQQDDFRGFESVMNLTRSSKSSTKTKIPKNYLAVNDFLSSTSNTNRY